MTVVLAVLAAVEFEGWERRVSRSWMRGRMSKVCGGGKGRLLGAEGVVGEGMAWCSQRLVRCERATVGLCEAESLRLAAVRFKYF